MRVITICFVDDPQQSIREVHRILKSNEVFILGYFDKDSRIAKQYLIEKDKSLFYKEARFFGLINLCIFVPIILVIPLGEDIPGIFGKLTLSGIADLIENIFV